MIGSETDSNAAVKETRHFLGDYFAVVSVSLKVDTALIKIGIISNMDANRTDRHSGCHARVLVIHKYNRLALMCNP